MEVLFFASVFLVKREARSSLRSGNGEEGLDI